MNTETPNTKNESKYFEYGTAEFDNAEYANQDIDEGVNSIE
jgi:hypothetical protein